MTDFENGLSRTFVTSPHQPAATNDAFEPANTQVIDLGIAWEWEYDKNFVFKLAQACKANEISTYLINPVDVDAATDKYRAGTLHFRHYLDRGSDALKEFEPLARLITSGGARIINHYRHLKRCLDKATMHLEFITAGLQVPYTIILSPYKYEPEIRITDLAKLGRSFIIKPAMGSGGTGVVVGAETLAEVLLARKSQNDQKFLLQEKIEPAMLDSERAWFRVFYVCGHTFLTWWNDVTHFYRAVKSEEEDDLGLTPMRQIIRTIAALSGLDFFSAEIALTDDGQFVVIDYVNDVCDMRLQSEHPDGVPDGLIDEIISTLISFVKPRSLYRQSGAIHIPSTLTAVAENWP
ncbi:MAG: ATP-grasp domain-containing protein [bacterium]